ncbi:MAG TPA: hypothetical protein PLL92_16125, partial [Alicycliphilus sp.]|nr:hypothetical protein [Alicycliphilus sp.]
FDLALREDADPAASGSALTYTLPFANTTTGTLAQSSVLRLPLAWVLPVVGGTACALTWRKIA